MTAEAWSARLAALFRFGLHHWLALYLVLSGLYTGLALLAPLAMHLGWTHLGTALHGLYFWFCHQEPGASYLILGRGEPLPEAWAHNRHWLGSPAIGWKTGLCQRNLAIYGSFFLSGLVFGLNGRRGEGLGFRAAVLLCLPMAVDGLTQVFGWRESIWLWRTLSGSLFSVGIAWALLPRVQAASREVLHQYGDHWP